MPKQNLLDRLAGAMKTLGKREGKSMTPRQRVAAAQRWNSISEIAENESTRLYDNWMNNKSVYNEPDEYLGRDEFKEFETGLKRLGLEDRYAQPAGNPFLSDNIDKYQEQSEFLDWCRYNHVRPSGQTLKQFRWETYQTLPYRQRQWIANKDAILGAVGPGDPIEFRNARTLRDWDAASKEWMGGDWDIQDLPVYNSYEEFPDDFDYMWRR